MKRKITLLFIAGYAALTTKAQVMISEDFTSPFDPATAGWVVQNLSSPLGASTWTQGNQTGGNGTFAAYNGNTNDFYCADFLTIPTNTNGGISAWLITPTVTIANGYVLQFATRTTVQTLPNIFPDRLQVRMATVDNTVIAASPTTAVGAFTDLLLDINPNLTTSTTSAVINGSVNGYPQAWTVYTVQITGVPSPVTGRFAFRYFVNDGGQTGANSRMVGVDGVRFRGACVTPGAISYTTCANTPITLTNTITGLSSTNFLWSNSGGTVATGSGYSFTTGSGTEVYTVQTTDNNVLCAASYSAFTTVTVTIGSNITLNVAMSPTDGLVCGGDQIILGVTNVGAASSYTWSSATNPNFATGSLVAISTSTVAGVRNYTVTGASGGCSGSASTQFTVLALPTISATVNNGNSICANDGVTITASGGLGYQYVFDPFYFPSFTTSNTRTLTSAQIGSLVAYASANTNDTIYHYVFGVGNNGCVGEYDGYFLLSPSPTISVVPAQGTVNACAKGGGAITVSGASIYTLTSSNTTYIHNATSTTNTIYFTTGDIGTSTGIGVTATITGKDDNGCKGTKTQIIKVNACTGIENIDGSVVETSVYPNPFTNELKIENLIGRVEIYNALGQVVISVPVKENELVRTDSLSKGVYILKAYNEQGNVVKTTKLMKN